MDETPPFCFVVMPFKPELHYFFIYMKNYIQDKYYVECERADEEVIASPVPMLDKIIADINRADIIIADATDKNTNVFYEIGVAHGRGKSVILITQDEMGSLPSDVRLFEFIRYSLTDHESFSRALDGVLSGFLFPRHAPLWEHSQRVLSAFRAATNANVTSVSKDEFIRRLRGMYKRSTFPSGADAAAYDEQLLRAVVAEGHENVVLEQITAWIQKVNASPANPSE